MNTHKIHLDLPNSKVDITFKDEEIVTDDIRQSMYAYADDLQKSLYILQTRYKGEIMSHEEAIAAIQTGKDLKEYYDYTLCQVNEECFRNELKQLKELPPEERIVKLDEKILFTKTIINRNRMNKIDTSDIDLKVDQYFIEKDLAQFELNNPKPANKNDEGISRIFINNGYSIFEKLNKSFVRDNEKKADYNYMYWQMKKDSLIHKGVVPTEFLNWLKSNSFMDDNVKQLYSENRAYSKARKQLYSSIIN